MDINDLPPQHPRRRRLERTIEQARDEKVAQLVAERDGQAARDVVVAGKTYRASGAERSILATKSRRTSTTTKIRDASGVEFTLTKKQITDIEDAIDDQVLAAWDAFWAKYDAVMVAPTVEAVDAV
jgi:cellobiose-specific phosphotransferase system component IIB